MSSLNNNSRLRYLILTKSFYKVTFVSGVFAAMSAGYVIGWQSPATVKLIKPDSDIPITSSQAAWMATAICLGGVIGPAIFAVTARRIGRKWITFIASSAYLLGWIVALVAENIIYLYVVRAFHGFGIAFTLCIVPVYVGEIVEDDIRGGVTSAITMMISLGAVVVYSVGPFVSFDILNLISLVFPLLALLCFMIMPESPHFLVMNNRLEEAERNLMRVRGETKKENVAVEFNNICKFVEESLAASTSTMQKHLLKKSSLISMFLITALTFSRQFSGYMVYKSFFEIIFKAADSPINPGVAVIIAESVALFVALFSCFFVDSLGRRPVFFISAVGTIIANLLTGTYYLIDYYDYVEEGTFIWIGMIGLYGFQVFFYIGMSSVPFVIASEIFPAPYKTWISAYMITVEFVFGFIAIKIHQILGDHIGYYYSFYIFACLTLLSTIYLAFALPETKKQPLVEIQHEISSPRASVFRRNSKMPQ